MSEPFLAEIKIVSFTFAPRGWAFCNGQLLPINQNQALFSLLGTTYGGDGRVNFALPNLQTRVPLHFSAAYPLGQSSGAQTHTLSIPELPAHVHGVVASGAPPDQASPANNFLPTFPATEHYSPPGSASATMLSSTSSAGGGQPHTNLQPYLVLNFVIALQGLFPSRN